MEISHSLLPLFGLDYCNFAPFKRIQNAAAKIILAHCSDHITSLSPSTGSPSPLHQKEAFCFKTLHYLSPPYLADWVTYCNIDPHLHSANIPCLYCPSVSFFLNQPTLSSSWPLMHEESSLIRVSHYHTLLQISPKDSPLPQCLQNPAGWPAEEVTSCATFFFLPPYL